MIEPFSSTPSVENIDDILRKKFNLHHGPEESSRGRRCPSLRFGCFRPGVPRRLCKATLARRLTGWPSGFYRLPLELTTWIVVLAELPKTAETRFLRLLGPATMQLEALRELDELPLRGAAPAVD